MQVERSGWRNSGEENEVISKRTRGGDVEKLGAGLTRLMEDRGAEWSQVQDSEIGQLLRVHHTPSSDWPT